MIDPNKAENEKIASALLDGESFKVLAFFSMIDCVKTFERILTDYGIVVRRIITWRNPTHTQMIIDAGEIDQVNNWHADSISDGLASHLFMWSNINSTQIKLGDGTELDFPDGSFLLIDNSVVRHRVKFDASRSKRWFGRCSI